MFLEQKIKNKKIFQGCKNFSLFQILPIDKFKKKITYNIYVSNFFDFKHD